MPAKIEIPNLSDLLQRYVAGESENKLAREAGINRWTFRQRLLTAHIDPRTQSEAEKLKWARMTPTQRERQVRAAHIAVRGRTLSFREKHAQALGKEKALCHVVPIETELATTLRTYGFLITQQKAIGVYNVDIAIHVPPIAVEIFGGSWHCYGGHLARFHKRVKYILDEGWHVVIIWLDARRYPLGKGAVEYLIALRQELSGNPASRCQYRVILGNGQLAPIRKSYLNTPADIMRLGCCTNATRSHN